MAPAEPHATGTPGTATVPGRVAGRRRHVRRPHARSILRIRARRRIGVVVLDRHVEIIDLVIVAAPEIAIAHAAARERVTERSGEAFAVEVALLDLELHAVVALAPDVEPVEHALRADRDVRELVLRRAVERRQLVRDVRVLEMLLDGEIVVVRVRRPRIVERRVEAVREELREETWASLAAGRCIADTTSVPARRTGRTSRATRRRDRRRT